MPSITIRDVPQETRDELAARAASSGRSLQEYVRGLLQDLAAKPDIERVLAQVRSRKQATASSVPAAEILAHRNADRR